LAYNEADNVLYYGFGTSGGTAAVQVIPIAGSGAYLTKNNNLSDLNNAQTSRNNLASNTVTSGLFMRGNGTNVLMGSIIASDVPTLNQNTTGNAGTVTSGVYTSRTLTAGSGLSGGGDLSSDKTFNIGQGDGITVSADSIAVDSTVVRTTGGQTIGGIKTFDSQVNISGNLGQYLLFRSTNAGNYANIVFDGNNYDAAVQSSYITSNTGNMEIAHGQKIQLNSTLEVKASNTTNSGLSHFAVFDSNPNSSLTVLKSLSRDQVLDDIGAVTSGLNLVAGSGLVGGGTLSTDRTFNIGQGDGITVSADAIAVDSTVVRTTGAQTISQVKTFTNTPIFNSGIQFNGSGNANIYFNNQINGIISSAAGASINIGDNIVFVGANNLFNYAGGAGEDVTFYDIDAASNVLRVSDRVSIKSPNGVVSGTYFPVWVSNPSGSAQVISSRTAAQLKGDIGLGNVTNDAQIKKLSSTSGGFVPTWNGTTGDALDIGYSVETTLTGGAGALPRADAVKTYVDSAITSGFSTNDAMVFKGTLGSGGTITALPTGTVSAGWSYRVITTGTYAGIVSEVGDLIIAVADAAGNVNSTWTVVQTNIDGAVVGPASSTTNALAVFNGTTGKLIQNSSFVPTTVGGNLINLTDPGAIRFLRINANNSISSLSDTDFRTAIGAGTSSTVGTVTAISAGNGMNYSPITTTGNIVLGTPSSITLSSTNSVTSTSHTHAFSPGGTTSQYIRGDGAATSGGALTKTDDTNVTLTIGGSPTNALLSATSLTVGWTGNLAVNRGGTGQTSYANGELLIGNTTGNTLTKATLTQGSNVTITNGNGSITIASTDTNTATAADDILDGSNTGTQITYAPYATNQAASASPRFYNTSDNPSGSGRLNVSAYFYATNLYDNGSRVVTAATICSDAGNCTWDGGSF
jgi:hypothetical protein